MYKKKFVKVRALFLEDGKIMPEEIIFDNHIFEIDKILDFRQAASLKAGGIGIRYKIIIKNKETYIFLEDNQWFVEVLDK